MKTITCAAILALFSLPVSAATLTQDQTAFDAATSGLTFATETFDGFNLSDQTSVDFGPFTAAGPNFDVTTPLSSFFCDSGQCLTNIDNELTLTFDTPIFALSWYAGSFYNEEIRVDGALIGTMTSLPDFGGIYSSTGFTTVNFLGQGNFPVDLFDIDNLSYASAAPSVVPLPASLPFAVFGLAALGLLRRRSA